MSEKIIFVSDLHLRDNVPICRKETREEYFDVQFKKLQFIFSTAVKMGCRTIAIAGDVFHKWKSSPKLIARTIKTFLKAKEQGVYQCYIIPGQHDLPNHSMERIKESSLWTLQASKVATILKSNETIMLPYSGGYISITGLGYGEELSESFSLEKEGEGLTKILLLHRMVYLRKNKPFPEADPAGIAGRIMRTYKWADVVVCGDNHEPFIVPMKNRLLINCGSMMRMTAEQIDYKPRLWLCEIQEEEKQVTPIYFPIEKDAVTREHIDLKEETNEKMEAFVKRAQEDYETGLSFERNIQKVLESGKISEEVKKIINEAINE